MNLFNLVDEQLQIAEKRKSNFSIEGTKIIKNAKEKFLKSQIVPIGQIQFRAADVTTAHAPLYQEVIGKQVIHKPYNTTNLVEMFGIKVIEGCKQNFTYPLWDGNIERGDSIFYNPDTGTQPTKYLEFTATSFYENLQYSIEVINASSSDLQAALSEDALKQIYDAVIFRGLFFTNLPRQASTITQLKNYLYNNSQYNGIVVMSPLCFNTLLKWSDNYPNLFKDNMLFGVFPYIVYDSKYLGMSKLVYFNPDDLLIAQFGGFDVTVDHLTERVKGIIKLHVEGWFDIKSKHYTDGALSIPLDSDGTEPTEDDTTDGDDTPTEDDTTDGQ